MDEFLHLPELQASRETEEKNSICFVERVVVQLMGPCVLGLGHWCWHVKKECRQL